MTDSVTVVQYSGYFQNEIRKLLNAGKVNEATEETRIQRILEEQRKRVQPVYEGKGKLVNIII